MSQAAALLASLSENASAYSSSEKHIVIGNDRFITVPESLKRLAVQYDHDVETVTFDCPRFWDEHDMSQMIPYINYLLPNGTTGQYKAKNVSSDSSRMYFDWTISNNVTQYNGKLSFLVCIKKTDKDGNEANHWNSELNQDCYISAGLECSQTAIVKYPDIITQLLTRMDEVEEISGGNGTGSGIHIGPEAPENPNTNVWLDTDEEIETENPVPEKLPSPYPITFTGAVEATYDGSEAVTVNIPEGGGTGGGSSGTWELIGEVTSDGAGDTDGIYVPIDFTQYKEVFIEAWIAAGAINRVLMSSNTAWYSGQVLNTNSTTANEFGSILNPRNENVLAQTIIHNICGELKPFSSWCTGYANGGKSVLQVSHARDTYLATSYSYIRMDTHNNGAVAEGNWLKVWGCK